MSDTNTLETLIDRYGITAGFTLIDERTDNLMPDTGPEWQRPMHYAFTLSADHGGITGNYSVGIGHLPSYDYSLRPTVDNVNQLKRERQKFRPATRDLVWSLLLDASIDPELSFRDWCLEYPDVFTSPADALDCYNALRDIRSKLQRIFRSDFDLAVQLAQEDFGRRMDE